MRDGAKRLLRILPWVGMAGFGWLALTGAMGDWWDDTSQDHSHARTQFFADLAYEGCVGQDAVIAQAEARGWSVRIMEEPLHWCHAPTGLTDWVHVDVSPPLPFSTEAENAAYFGFGSTGCMVRWRYTSGEGSTCEEE